MKKSPCTLIILLIFQVISEVEVKSDNGWSLVGNPLAFAHPCNGSDDISTSFEVNRPPEEENSYSVYIGKTLPVSTKIKLKFDADASVVLHNKSFARISYEANDNSFLIRFFKESKHIAFEVKGLTLGVVPYFKSLNINNVEYCEDPEVGYLDHHIQGYVDHAESPGKEPGNCGRRKVTHTELIVNGLPTKAGDWPWHAALYQVQRSQIKYICGGTLITNFFVLTAAHCASIRGEQVLPEILSVVLGKFNLVGGDEGTQEKEVHQIIIHDQFDHRRLHNDVALLKLKAQATFTDYVQPACLWYSKAYDKLPTDDIYGVTVGWGFDISDTLSPQLKQAKMPIVSESACIKTNPLFYSRILNDHKFCAGYKNGTSACNGDSGGAFQVFVPDLAKDSDPKAAGTWHIRGIVSVSVARTDVPVCDPTQYVVFTDVAKYLQWIENHIS